MRRVFYLLGIGALLSTLSVANAQPPGVPAAKLPKTVTETKVVSSTATRDLAPTAGIVFQAGAFDLSANPEAMVLADLGFPVGIRFVREPMEYFGEYTDPNTQINGWLYSVMIGPKQRYFLVAQTSISDLSGPLQ